jgi:acetyltransferase-like isoleucine patch superfamily enzyme
MGNLKIYLRYEWPLFLVLFLTNWLPDNMIFIELRGFLASFFFKSCGKRLRLQRNVSFTSSDKIIIGNKVTITYGCRIIAGESIEFQDNSALSPYVVMSGASYELFDPTLQKPKSYLGKIVLEKGSWVGSHCTVLDGTVVGENSVITANSLLNRRIPPNCIYGGNPIKKLGTRF